MTDYRRYYISKATWFFTVNLAERKNNRLLVEKIDELRNAFKYEKKQKPFRINAIFDSIHWNPVKHNKVARVADWPHSCFHRYVKQGIYSKNWGNGERFEIEDVE